MSLQWGKTRAGRSWHLFATFTRMPGMARSVCNRNLVADTVRDDRPGHARSCESCLRAHVAAEERAEEDPGMGVVAPI